MSTRVDLWLDSDDVDAAQSSGGYRFVIPDDAVKRGNLNDPADDKAKASWMQRLTITEAKFFEDTTKGDEPYECITAEITFQVPPDATRNGQADPNAGKQHRAWYRIVPAAMKNKNHPKYKANNFAIGKLNAICRAIWGESVFPHGQKVNIGEYFGGDNPPVVGQNLMGNVRVSKWNGEPRDEITDFVPLSLL